MHVSVAEVKARFTAIAKLADAGEEIVITNRGKPAYRLLALTPTARRAPFPDISALAAQSRRSPGSGSFVQTWRDENERFGTPL
jgi:prevent-host-death family protein